MQQITKEEITALLHSRNIELKSTQTKLCIPIVNRLYVKMKIGIRFSGIKVADGLIIDGHHRYLASLLANFDLEQIPSSTTSATIITDWNLVEFVDEDWDTEAKVKMLNQRDAEYNDIPFERIVELLK